MAGIAISFPPYIYLLLTESRSGLLTAMAVTSVLNTLYLGPSIAMSHALVPPSMRALTSAVLLFVINIIGLGLGPFLTGLSSDLLQPAYGEQSLRYSMLITAQVKLLSVLMFFQGARYLIQDLAQPADSGRAQA